MAPAGFVKGPSRLKRLLTPISCLGAAAAADGVAVGGRVLVPGGDPLPEADVALLAVEDPLAEALASADGAPPEPAARAVNYAA